MATIASALDTVFTPAAADFTAQVVGIGALVRRNTSGATWTLVSTIVNSAVVVSNPTAGVQYMFTAPQAAGVAVQADQ